MAGMGRSRQAAPLAQVTAPGRSSTALSAQTGQPGSGESRGVSAGTVRRRASDKFGVSGTLRLVGHGYMQETVEVDNPEWWLPGQQLQEPA